MYICYVMDEIFQGIDTIREALNNPSKPSRYDSVSETMKTQGHVQETHYLGVWRTMDFNFSLDCAIIHALQDSETRTTRFNFKLTIDGGNVCGSQYCTAVRDMANRGAIVHRDIQREVCELDVLIGYHPGRKEYSIRRVIGTVRFDPYPDAADLYETTPVIYHNYRDIVQITPAVLLGKYTRLFHGYINDLTIMLNLRPYLAELWEDNNDEMNKEDIVNEQE